MSIRNLTIIKIAKLGFTVNNGVVTSHRGVTKSLTTDDMGYLQFGYCDIKITVHRFVAYLKFGDYLFNSGLHVRHLDGDKKNNNPNNLELGTPAQNSQDIPAIQRSENARKGALQRTANGRVSGYDEATIIQRKRNGAKHYELESEFKISKRTLSRIMARN